MQNVQLKPTVQKIAEQFNLHSRTVHKAKKFAEDVDIPGI
jgi:hypothetical protein